MERKFTLDNEFIEYCRINNIEDVDKLAKETFKTGFDMLKYGNKLHTILHPPMRPKLDDKDAMPLEVFEEKVKVIKDKINNDLYGE
jgi:hypothetical protein